MRIAFIVSSFPAISETFILNQITCLVDMGHEVDIFAAAKGDNPKVHSDVEKYDLLSRTSYYGLLGNKMWRVLKTVWLLISKGKPYPLVIIRSLDFFKYGKRSLSLRLFYKAIPFLGKEPYDIVHCHFGPNGNVGALSSWSASPMPITFPGRMTFRR
ncbi:glycosyltransferase [Candidatus Fermentibacteria bacterium]|nr:glycosyltransferase [Candidatus Fermentibacteria bacterium]